jgi:hypothetical protein
MKYTSQLLTALGIIVIICGFGTLFWYISWDGPIIEYGTITQTEDFPVGVFNPKITFNAIGISASFEVLIEDLEDNSLFEIRNKISGPKQLSKNYEEKVDHWVITSDDFGNYSADYERQQETTIYRYRHEIQIVVDYQAIVTVDFETNVGDLTINSDENQIDLSVKKLATLGGEIQVYILGANSTLDFDTFETLDGGVRLFLAENSTVIGNLKLSAFNGPVSFNCSESTYLNLENLLIQTNNGNSGVLLDNIFVTSDFNFTIFLVVGSLNMTWNQDTYTTDSQFFISVNSGNVDVLLNFHPDIGTSFETEIVSGNEEVPSDSSGTNGMGEISFFISTYSGNVNVTRI